MTSLKNALLENDILILDGALGTEIENRGFNINHKLWSALCLIEKPNLIYDIHLDYLRAGADILTTSSYQISIQGLMENLKISENEALKILTSSVTLAKNAREDFLKESSNTNQLKPTPILIGGDIGPYAAYLADGSEYTGQYTIDQTGLENYHRKQIRGLQAAGCDFLIIETIPNHIEVKALIHLLETEFSTMEAYLSVTTQNGHDLTDGTPLKTIAKYCHDNKQVLAMGINCSSPHHIETALTQMSRVTNKPFVTYPNSGEIYDCLSKTWQNGNKKEANLLNNTYQWIQLGAKIVGGCCRTSPDDIYQLSKALKEYR